MLLFGAGTLAGLAGTAGGITSLISYPALLAAGLSPLRANMTNSVAVIGNWPGSTMAARPELQGRARHLGQLVPVAAAGGLAGTVLLLGTPAKVFDVAVPFFLVAASIALLCQPRLATWRRRHLERSSRYLFFAGLFGVCAYDGYFGAGSGVMLLALLLIAIDEQLPRANAYKNFLLGVSDVISAVGFAVFGSVDWLAAASVGLGALVGGAFGPRLTRRLPPGPLRVAVALVGIGLAVKLFLSPN
ncbi:MAG TPA: sulfite exporter TauE/SafE family protein [Acidimicrobiales bacterium]|nr:sulfite exporter TauE/SafE family protein [Acidimicrobiales bacterium]